MFGDEGDGVEVGEVMNGGERGDEGVGGNSKGRYRKGYVEK